MQNAFSPSGLYGLGACGTCFMLRDSTSAPGTSHGIITESGKNKYLERKGEDLNHFIASFGG